MKIAHWLKRASHELAQFDSARLDADLLMCYVLDCERTKLYAWPEKELSTEQITQLNALLEKRKLGQPIAYIIKKREFWSLEFDVCKDVLVPRADTELIVSLALLGLPDTQGALVLDAGTGSGAIAVALAYQWHTGYAAQNDQAPTVIACDSSNAALMLAKRNAKKHVPDCISFVRSNWLDAFDNNSFNMIVSNPPYLARDDAHLNNKTLQHEPIAALVSGEDGLDDIRQIIKDALRAGTAGCYVLLEHGATQADAVRSLMAQSEYTNIQTHQDIAGLDRVTCGFCP